LRIEQFNDLWHLFNRNIQLDVDNLIRRRIFSLRASFLDYLLQTIYYRRFHCFGL